MASVWDGYAGHAAVRDAFARASARGRLTQAYLFVGPEGVGKREFARRLAQCLLCERRDSTVLEACGECGRCRPFLAGTHPDFLLVQRDPGKRELAVAKFVGEREQRGKSGLCYELSVRPVEGSRKIAIIDDADTMNDEAANAILKTLEEPPEGAIIFLIVSNPDAVLPTIRSRCQSVRFGPLPDDDIVQYALQTGLAASASEAESLAQLARGSRALAGRLAQPGFRELRQEWLGHLAASQWDGMRTSRQVLDAIEKLSNELPEQRQFTIWLLQAAADFYRSALRLLSWPEGASAVSEELTRWTERWGGDLDLAVDEIGALMDRCALAMRHIEQNVSLGLCLEALCSDLSRMARTR